MATQTFHPRTGLRSYDAAEFSRDVAIEGTYAGESRFSSLYQVSDPEPVEIASPAADDHVVLVWLDRFTPFRTGLGGEKPNRLVRPLRHGVAILPAGTSSVWDCFEGTPGTLHLHLSGSHLDALLGEPAPNGRIDLAPTLFTRDDALAQIATACRTEMAAPGPAQHLFMESQALALAVRLFRGHRLGVRRAPSGEYALAPYRLARVRECVEAKLDTNMTLAELAAAVGLSPFHFARAFKKTTGVTPYRYVIERRVERARALLADPRLRLVEVALACGFGSQQQFTTMFRRLTGMTPGAYRKSQG